MGVGGFHTCLRNEEVDPLDGPGVIGLRGIVAGGNDPPKPGGFSLGEIDPSSCPAQPVGPRSSGDPTHAAIEALLHAHEILPVWRGGPVLRPHSPRRPPGPGAAAIQLTPPSRLFSTRTRSCRYGGLLGCSIRMPRIACRSAKR